MKLEKLQFGIFEWKFGEIDFTFFKRSLDGKY